MYTYHELAFKKLATRIIDSAARRTELYYIMNTSILLFF